MKRKLPRFGCLLCLIAQLATAVTATAETKDYVAQAWVHEVAQAGDFSLVQGAILAPIVIGAGDAKVVSLAARLKRANLVLPDSPQNKSGNSVVDCNLYRWQGRFAQCVDDISRDGDGGTMTHALCGAFVRKMHQMAHLFPMDQIA